MPLNDYNPGSVPLGVVIVGQMPSGGGAPVVPPSGAAGDPSYVTAGAPTTVTVTIPNGGSLSPAVQVSGKVVGIITPAAWTAAGLTFQGGQTATTVNVYDDAVERTVASAAVPTAESRLLSLDLNDWLGVNFVKFRSGTAAAPVVQGADRVFTVILAG